MKLKTITLLFIAIFTKISCDEDETESKPLEQFERIIKAMKKPDNNLNCLSGDVICKRQGLIMSGILFDVLNRIPLEYTSEELKPIIEGLKYVKKYFPDKFEKIMSIHDKKQITKI